MNRFSLIVGILLVPFVGPALGQTEPATQDVSFVAACDGTTQRYVLLFPPGFKKDRPCDLLIALHGHGSDRWQYIKNNRGTCKAARDVAMRHRMIFVSPDYRAKTSWMGPKAEADLVQIIAGLKDQYAVKKVFLTGGSMGGSSCLTFAALHPDLIDGVASMNGTANHLEYANFQDAIRRSFGGTKAEIPLEYKKRSAEYWPERFSMPVGITASGKDESVPPHSVMRLADVLRKMNRKVLLIYRPETGHVTSHEDATKVIEFVIRQSATTPSSAK